MLQRPRQQDTVQDTGPAAAGVEAAGAAAAGGAARAAGG